MTAAGERTAVKTSGGARERGGGGGGTKPRITGGSQRPSAGDGAEGGALVLMLRRMRMKAAQHLHALPARAAFTDPSYTPPLSEAAFTRTRNGRLVLQKMFECDEC